MSCRMAMAPRPDGAVERRRLHLERPGVRGRKLEAQFLRLPGGQNRAQQLVQARIANQFEQELSFRPDAPEIDGLEKGRVRKRHPQLVIHGEHALGHARQNGFAARRFIAQAVHQLLHFDRHAGERAFEGTQLVARILNRPVFRRAAGKTFGQQL